MRFFSFIIFRMYTRSVSKVSDLPAYFFRGVILRYLGHDNLRSCPHLIEEHGPGVSTSSRSKFNRLYIFKLGSNQKTQEVGKKIIFAHTRTILKFSVKILFFYYSKVSHSQSTILINRKSYTFEHIVCFRRRRPPTAWIAIKRGAAIFESLYHTFICVLSTDSSTKPGDMKVGWILLRQTSYIVLIRWCLFSLKSLVSFLFVLSRPFFLAHSF